MWFLFGFVTITLSVGFEFWRRHFFSWSVDGTTSSGYEYKHSAVKGKVRSLRLGVNCSAMACFSIQHQTPLDNYFKRLGISNEQETGDEKFDNAYYLLSDNTSLVSAISAGEVYRSAVKKIMRFGSTSGVKANEIHCRNGRLWIDFSAGDQYDESKVDAISRALSKELEALLQLINEVVQISGSTWRDPFVYKAVLVLAISSGLAINGAVQYFRTSYGELPFIMYPKELVIDALMYSLLALPILLLMTLYWLGRGSRTHFVLLELVTIGALGLFASVAFEMRDINIEFDQSKPQFFETAIIDKYTTTHRRRKSHHISVKNWDCDCGTYSLPVSDSTAKLSSVSNPVIIAQHAGYLGYRWISKVDVHWYGR